VLLAMSVVEVDRDRVSAGRSCTVGGRVTNGLPFLDAAMVLLRVRLADVVTRVWNEPVPYVLTERAL
jgi:hypothetical protein